jgi:hypothetical protein
MGSAALDSGEAAKSGVYLRELLARFSGVPFFEQLHRTTL